MTSVGSGARGDLRGVPSARSTVASGVGVGCRWSGLRQHVLHPSFTGRDQNLTGRRLVTDRCREARSEEWPARRTVPWLRRGSLPTTGSTPTRTRRRQAHGAGVERGRAGRPRIPRLRRVADARPRAGGPFRLMTRSPAGGPSQSPTWWAVASPRALNQLGWGKRAPTVGSSSTE